MARAIQILRDTIAALSAKIPRSGMPFYVTDTKETGIGDGTSTVSALLNAGNAGADYALSTTGTTTPTIPAAARTFDLLLQLAAGSGSYTRKIVLATANRRERDKVLARIEVAASANPNVWIHNASDTTDPLLLQPGDPDTAQVLVATFIFRSGAWTILSVIPSNL